METTKHSPNIHVSKFKRTKIIATVGPATANYEAILNLIKAGANGIRLNFSHGTYQDFEKIIHWVRKASREYGKPIAIIQDLQGPKVRFGDFDGVCIIQDGQSLQLGYETDYERSGILPVQYDLSKKVKRGERVLMFDGRVRTTVTSVKDGIVHVKAENDGIVIAKKGINLPDTDFAGDVLTQKDIEDLAFGSTQDIDIVAMSFVQSAEDIINLRRKMRNLNYNARVMAKIETKAAISTMESIVEAADMVMIARGDLAPEVSFESVPVYQRQIVDLGIKYCKPTVVATQMMGSMVDQPEPTRAEVSDVASAVLMGADAVMLSEETAVGKYPIQAVESMKRIIQFTHENIPDVPKPTGHVNDQTRQAAISTAIIKLADQVRAVAIVAETKSGATALQISSRRPRQPIIVVTSDPKVAHVLAISYGTKTFVRKDSLQQSMRLTEWLRTKRVLSKGDIVVMASGQYPGVVGTTDTIKVRILE